MRISAAPTGRGACVIRGKPMQLGMALSACALWLAGCEANKQAAPGLPPVEFIDVMQRDVPVTKEWVATLDGFVNAQIRAQVKGLLVAQRYVNGAFVRKDSPLFEIDPRPFQATLDQANA